MKKKIEIKSMRKTFTAGVLVLLVIISAVIFYKKDNAQMKDSQSTWWEVQSVDNVKYSRDLAREMANSKSFDETIETQTRLIAETGATHIAIGTPYDEEFLPFLRRWVKAARANNLKVWFRGNMSGWERWFGYDRISREEHTKQIEKFILANGSLFQDGDIFSSCPECENGGPGDPRLNGDPEGHKAFLINEYRITTDAFRKIGKGVSSNYHSMNGDVANLIMDKETTKALGGLVVIDHYVGTGDKLRKDIINIAQKSGGKVFLGEFGAPIPDIHGDLTEEEQAFWVEDAMSKLVNLEELTGVNYWVAFGGSTEIFSDDAPREAVSILQKYFKPKKVNAKVLDESGKPVEAASVAMNGKKAYTDEEGEFAISYIKAGELRIEAVDYLDKTVSFNEISDTIYISREKEGFFYRIMKIIHTLVG